MNNAQAIIEARKIRKLLWELHPKVRHQLIDGCWLGDDGEPYPDAMEAAEYMEIGSRDGMPEIDALRCNMSLRPIGIRFNFEGNHEEGYSLEGYDILEDSNG